MKGVTIVIVDEKGNLVSNWRIYRKLSLAYLTPKVGDKFLEIFSSEEDALREMLNYFTEIDQDKSEFSINDMLEKASRYEISELVEYLTSLKVNIKDVIEILSKIIRHRSRVGGIVDEVISTNNCEILDKFIKEITIRERKLLEKLDRTISKQGYILFDLTNIIREIGMRKKDAANLLVSINNYISRVRKFRGDLHKMIYVRRLILSMRSERKHKVKEYYERYLSRVGPSNS